MVYLLEFVIAGFVGGCIAWCVINGTAWFLDVYKARKKR